MSTRFHRRWVLPVAILGLSAMLAAGWYTPLIQVTGRPMAIPRPISVGHITAAIMAEDGGDSLPDLAELTPISRSSIE